MNFPPKNILVPTDFSKGAEVALDYALELAGKVGGKVHLLHAYMIPAFPEDGGVLRQLVTEMETVAEKTLDQLAEKRRSTGALGQLLVKVGDAREQIIQCAVDLQVDLLVMGTHGRRGLKRMFLGSVAEAVLRMAPCPVLVVPLRASER